MKESDISLLAPYERACAEARANEAAFMPAARAYAAALGEQDSLGELIRRVARGDSKETLDELRAACVAPLFEGLPTRATLEALPTLDAKKRAEIPIAGEQIAAPVEFEWRGAFVETAHFEVYDQRSPLGPISASAYRTFLQIPACRLARRLVIGNLACNTFESAPLVGDPVELLAREGLPLYLERLSFCRLGPVSNAGDLGYIATERLKPLHARLSSLTEIDFHGCVKLGKLVSKNLRILRLLSDVTPTNLKELAQADLPSLVHLDLGCDLYAEPAQRWRGARALLRSKRLPALRSLELDELDLDEEQREELEYSSDEGDEDASDPGPWIDMIADSPLLRRLERLSVAFRDDDRELARLCERAEAFQHLAALTFRNARGSTVTVERPTREKIEKVMQESTGQDSSFTM